ncbi:VCBS repeat-containing protein [Streptomyces europaeiscabiei]|uniref:FG-GAP repeat domain-containing protein n=1 Tax=Streptomyces europaeiscabiei TaxID=146819 RepID=UPI002E10A6CF
MRFRSATMAATLVAATVTPLAFSVSIGPAAAAPAKYADDFNGDGYRDNAVFSYGTETYFSKGGGVLVTFGTANGPGTKTQFIDQASAGVPGADETDDFFGEIRTAADFNKDGYGDLVVSANGENVGKYKDNGTVTVLWGGKKGLSGGTTVPFKGPKGVSGEARDFATGDFNGDGSQDLALVRDGKTYVYRGAIAKSGVKGSVTVLDKDGAGFYSTALISGKVNKAAGPTSSSSATSSPTPPSPPTPGSSPAARPSSTPARPSASNPSSPTAARPNAAATASSTTSTRTATATSPSAHRSTTRPRAV